MEIKRPIQIIYAPGTFGNCVRWMFDRFTKGSKFKDMSSPWDEHGRVHGFNDDDYNTEKFVRGHQVKGRADSPIQNTDKVVLSFDPKDIVFADEPCSNLDRTNSEQVLSVFKELNENIIRYLLW